MQPTVNFTYALQQVFKALNKLNLKEHCTLCDERKKRTKLYNNQTLWATKRRHNLKINETSDNKNITFSWFENLLSACQHTSIAACLLFPLGCQMTWSADETTLSSVGVHFKLLHYAESLLLVFCPRHPEIVLVLHDLGKDRSSEEDHVLSTWRILNADFEFLPTDQAQYSWVYAYWAQNQISKIF